MEGNPAPTAPHQTATTQAPAGVEYAGFWIRVAALLIDALILSAITTVAIFVLFGFSEVLANLIGFIIGLSYYIALHGGEWQATIGKKAMGLRVMRADGSKVTYGRATGRYFAQILSGLVFCIGYIMAGFTDQKKALHDIIVDTRVVYAKK